MKAKTTMGFNPLMVFKRHHPINSFLSLVLALAVINLSTSCSYYKVKDLTTSQEEINKRITNFNESEHYAIIHSGDELFHLSNIKIDKEQNVLTGTCVTLNPGHQYKKARKESGPNRFKTKIQDPISEIHIKLNTNISPEVAAVASISFNDIHSISLNKRDGLTEFATVLLGIVGVLGGIFLIILATKSSCPFVYVKNGDTYKFMGELYPGVLTENMQRDDYIPLGKFDETKREYSIKVTNELKEIQHTDLLELIVIDHPTDIQVLLDDNGSLHTFSNLHQPISTVIDDHEYDVKTLLEKDGNFYAFNSTSNRDDNLRHVIFEFDIPENSSNTKLYLTAKNSMWLDYIFGKFNEQFGSYYQEFQVQQQTRSKEQSEKWIVEQHIPLSVYVETSNGWQLVDKINTVGPLAFRDLVVPIDSKYITQEKLRVKLETGFMFWEVDYVAMDHSSNLSLNINYILPYEAIDHNNRLVTKLLSSKDNVYLTQSKIGDEVTVNFNLENINISDSHSVFLKNRGYYNYVRDFNGEPNLEALKLFKKEGVFTDFSKLEYYSLMGIEDDEFIAQKE
jgi:hypothetical protein